MNMSKEQELQGLFTELKNSFLLLKNNVAKLGPTAVFPGIRHKLESSKDFSNFANSPFPHSLVSSTLIWSLRHRPSFNF